MCLVHDEWHHWSSSTDSTLVIWSVFFFFFDWGEWVQDEEKQIKMMAVLVHRMPWLLSVTTRNIIKLGKTWNISALKIKLPEWQKWNSKSGIKAWNAINLFSTPQCTFTFYSSFKLIPHQSFFLIPGQEGGSVIGWAWSGDHPKPITVLGLWWFKVGNK